jgi:alpha-beta hydrolase superfamily lysophospholipase
MPQPPGVNVSWSEATVRRRVGAGPPLYQVTARPRTAHGIVGLLHGYADHAGRYAHVMAAWAERGLACVALDMRGHGRAAGARGFCTRFTDYLDDAAELARLTSEAAPGCPAFLYGHSFGGLVAVHAVMQAPHAYAGLLLGSPYFELARPVPALKLLAGRIASRVAPGFSLPTGLRGADVTHDPAKASGYDTDPLVFNRATARWFTETAAAQGRAHGLAPALSLPLRVVVGGADPVAGMAASRRFFDAAGSLDKTWDERRGLRHEVLNEPEWEPIAAVMATWMLERLGRRR